MITLILNSVKHEIHCYYRNEDVLEQELRFEAAPSDQTEPRIQRNIPHVCLYMTFLFDFIFLFVWQNGNPSPKGRVQMSRNYFDLTFISNNLVTFIFIFIM